MNIPQEVRERIFALYYGQFLVSSVNNMMYPHRVNSFLSDDGEFDDTYYLEVTCLGNISDEDLSAIGFKFPKGKEGITVNFYPNSYDAHWRSYRYGHFLKDGYLSLKDFDYLRSRGYALPAFGYTVQQLVDAGIFKLKT